MTTVDAWGGSWGSNWALTWTYDVPVQPVTSSGGSQGAGGRRRRLFDYPNVVDDGNALVRFLQQRRGEPQPGPRRAKARIDRHPGLAERLLAFHLGEPMPQEAEAPEDQDEAALRASLFRQLQLA